MSRLGGKKREQQQSTPLPYAAAAPIDVHVPAGGEAGTGRSTASVGGVTVTAGPGEEVHQAVLNLLQRIALASGHAVLATVRDERLGYVVPVQVDLDGSSRTTGRPAPIRPAGKREPLRATEPARKSESASGPEPMRGSAARYDSPTHRLRTLPKPQSPSGPAPAPDTTGVFSTRPVPAPGASQEAGREWTETETTLPGTVAPATGVFGPPPLMGHPTRPAEPDPTPAPASHPARAFAPDLAPQAEVNSAPEDELDPDPKPAKPRGFDAVAEVVLGDGFGGASGEQQREKQFAEPMARVSEAVRSGRIDAAALLAEETVAEASAALGGKHTEVLRLRELTAYIAYLAGEPLRAFRLSLGLALDCRGQDAEAAYGNVRSAATAWRAVRDPQLGLELGHELIALWAELSVEGGPAADEIEELEAARTRMHRLTERVHAQQT